MSGDRKVVQLPVKRNLDRDGYLARLHDINMELQEMAGSFNVSLRTALCDLTYIVIGDDIMANIQSMDEE